MVVNARVTVDNHEYSNAANDASIELLKQALVHRHSRSAEIYRPINALSYGIIFVDSDNQIYTENIPNRIFDVSTGLFGWDAEKFNKVFYSFEKTENTPKLHRLFDQISHYLSTYGRESLGLNSSPYLPMNEVDPDFGKTAPKDFKNFTIIRIVPWTDGIGNLKKYFTKIRQPSHNDIYHLKKLIGAKPTSDFMVSLTMDDVLNKISSKEVFATACSYCQTLPENPEDALRLMVFSSTNSPVLIKNKTTIDTIKRAAEFDQLSAQILREYDHQKFAQIFNRYKPIFLAYKAGGVRNSEAINHISRLSKTLHLPMNPVRVSNFANLIKEEHPGVLDIIEKASVPELFKLANYMINSGSEIGVYSIRNGKTFVHPKEDAQVSPLHINCLVKILETISRKLSHLRGKEIYIPQHITYSCPVSEKQFVGVYPYGTKISFTTTPETPISVGIHWTNIGRSRVDLDLHGNGPDLNLGWNNSWAMTDRKGGEAIYSGDMTDAPLPNGAAEAFYLVPAEFEKSMIALNVSKYSAPDGRVPFQLFMCRNAVKNGVFDPAQQVCPPIPLNFLPEDNDTKTIGFIDSRGFYFYGGSISQGVVPGKNYKDFCTGVKNKVTNRIDLLSILMSAGAEIVFNREDIKDKENFISLDPADITSPAAFMEALGI